MVEDMFHSLIKESGRKDSKESSCQGECIWGWGKGVSKLVSTRDENACPVLEGGMKKTKEDGERVKGILYGCSSFFFSDIRFFLAASIS